MIGRAATFSEPIRFLLALAALCLAALTLSAFGGALGQPFELFSHFRFQYAAAALGGVVVAFLFRARPAAALFAASFAVNAAAMICGVLSAAAKANGAATTLVWANLHRDGAALAAAATLARKRGADIVALTELPASDPARVRSLFPDFACFTEFQHPVDVFSSMIVARTPCATAELPAEGHANSATLADFETLRVIALHPRPPWDNSRTAERDAVMRAAYAAAEDTNRPAILLGDFNATPWSYIMMRARPRGFLRARCGAPFAPTWRSQNLLFGLPIDHAIVSRDLGIGECKVGPDIDSDHFPLIVRIAPALR